MPSLEQLVLDLVSYPTEQEWFEFKENWYNPHALGEYISALSNAAALKGLREGYLVWGVSDDAHELVGTDFDWRRDVKGEPLEHYLARNTSPSVAFRFDEANVSGCRVVVLAVPAAIAVPTAFDGARYQRVGSSKVNLLKHPERESQLFQVLAKGPASTENTEAQDQDLSFGRLFTYYAGRGIGLRQETFAKNLGLLTSAGKYNVLAQLLSDDCRTPVRVSLFTGATKASTLYSVREFGNTCLLVALDRVLDYGEVLNVPQADERGRVVERKEIPLFDAEVYREAVVNAFVHNRWIDGNAPMVTVFSDRVEILSRGTLPPGQSLEGFFQGESVPVNQRLSDIFLQLHISERSGRGVPRIVNRYGRGCYEFRENSIVVTIPFERIDAERNVVGVKPAYNVGDIPVRLNDTQRKVLDAMRDNPSITHVQLMSSLGLGRTSIQNAVTHLRKSGLIERVGSNKAGWWRVVE